MRFSPVPLQRKHLPYQKHSYCNILDLSLGKSAFNLSLSWIFFFFRKDYKILHMGKAKITGL